jgi:hypothetical protein
MVLRIEPRASHMLGKHPTTELPPQSSNINNYYFTVGRHRVKCFMYLIGYYYLCLIIANKIQKDYLSSPDHMTR